MDLQGLGAYCVGAAIEEILLNMILLRLHHHLLDNLYCVCSGPVGVTKLEQPVRLEGRFYVVFALWQAIFGQCLAS